MTANIPFFKNSKDETHCLQACMKMVLKYHFPKKRYTFNNLDKEMMISEKKVYTTFPQAVVVLDKLGIKCKYLTQTKNGYENYLKMGIEEYHNNTSGQSTNVIKDIDLHFSKKGWNMGLIKEKELSIENLKKMIYKNYLALAMIDYNGLKENKSYDGHVVLVKSIKNNKITINDPGPPAIEDRIISRKDFLKIWHDPDNYRSVLVVFGKK